MIRLGRSESLTIYLTRISVVVTTRCFVGYFCIQWTVATCQKTYRTVLGSHEVCRYMVSHLLSQFAETNLQSWYCYSRHMNDFRCQSVTSPLWPCQQLIHAPFGVTWICFSFFLLVAYCWPDAVFYLLISNISNDSWRIIARKRSIQNFHRFRYGVCFWKRKNWKMLFGVEYRNLKLKKYKNIDKIHFYRFFWWLTIYRIFWFKFPLHLNANTSSGDCFCRLTWWLQPLVNIYLNGEQLNMLNVWFLFFCYLHEQNWNQESYQKQYFWIWK